MNIQLNQICVIIYLIPSVLCKLQVHINSKYIANASINTNGNDYSELQISELRFLPQKDNIEIIESVQNFRDIYHLKIQNQGLTKIPKFINVSQSDTLSEIYLSKNKLTYIPKGSFNFNRTFMINLDFNEIHTIEDNSFETSWGINLNCNKLTEFNKTWFSNPKVVQNIFLKNNLITSLKPDDFFEFGMKYLVLSSNRIKQLPANVFNFKFRFLHTLDISDNQLYEISPDIFPDGNTTHLSRFKMEFNRLSFISEDVLSKIKVTYGFFSGNPWQCPCLKKLEKWARDTHVYHWIVDEYKDSLPVCIYAKAFSNVCIPYVEKELYDSYINGTTIKYLIDCEKTI